ncbi:MAG: hypothetical protein JWP97_296 [Labilithrix sp.]|nr:hypothetical protein [Labilithrix sp.]
MAAPARPSISPPRPAAAPVAVAPATIMGLAPPPAPEPSAQWMADDEVLLEDAAAEDPAPSSGVRVSDEVPAIVDPSDALSFKVYTLADLERRSDAPPAMARPVDAVARRKVLWRAAWASVCAFATATLGWSRTRNELGLREPVRTALRQPFDRLGDDLQAAIESLDWKKYGVVTGIVTGASLALLFAVLFAAELTDDLKAGSGSHLASADALDVTPPPRAAPVLAPTPVIAPEPAATTVVVTSSDEDEAPAPPKRAAKKPKAKGKLTYRNADAIFNP